MADSSTVVVDAPFAVVVLVVISFPLLFKLVVMLKVLVVVVPSDDTVVCSMLWVDSPLALPEDVSVKVVVSVVLAGLVRNCF